MVLVVTLVAPILYKIEKTTTNTAKQVDSVASEVRTLEAKTLELVKQAMKDDELWKRAKKVMSDPSIRASE